MSAYIALAAAAFVVIFVVAVVIWAVFTSNRFNRQQVKIGEAESGIDVALEKRYNTLTKLLAACKAYTKHEADLLGRVVMLRTGMDLDAKAAAGRQMDEVGRQLNLVAESYPQLRSSDNYLQLQAAVADAEEHLQAARRVYNMNVSAFNQGITVFPGRLVAGAKRLAPRAFFMAEEHKRQDVGMVF